MGLRWRNQSRYYDKKTNKGLKIATKWGRRELNKRPASENAKEFIRSQDPSLWTLKLEILSHVLWSKSSFLKTMCMS